MLSVAEIRRLACDECCVAAADTACSIPTWEDTDAQGSTNTESQKGYRSNEYISHLVRPRQPQRASAS